MTPRSLRELRGRSAPVQLIYAVGVGLLIGAMLGYVFMGTADAVLRINSALHSGGRRMEEPLPVAAAASSSARADELLHSMRGSQALLHQEADAEQAAGAEAAQARRIVEPQGQQLQLQQLQAAQQAEAAAAEAAAAERSADAQPASLALDAMTPEQLPWPRTGQDIQTVCTSNGSPYLNFQNRIMFATFQAVRSQPGGEHLVAFTRILHRQEPDLLMHEIPTFRADPLTPLCDTWCEFPVADRPNAVRQWLEAALRDTSLIKAPWVLMTETDYVWMRPPQAPRAEDAGSPSWAFPFGYIRPAEPSLDGVIRKMFPITSGPTSRIPGSGPAPAMLRAHEWAKVTPDWERVTAQIEADAEAKEKLGWVREMYAFSIAMALQDIKLDLQLPPESPLISQPPADNGLGNAAAFHYTWGSIVSDGTGEVWRFDKRDYTEESLQRKVPLIPEPPPFKEGWVLQDGKPISRALYDVLLQMVVAMNAAIQQLPDLT